MRYYLVILIFLAGCGDFINEERVEKMERAELLEEIKKLNDQLEALEFSRTQLEETNTRLRLRFCEPMMLSWGPGFDCE